MGGKNDQHDSWNAHAGDWSNSKGGKGDVHHQAQQWNAQNNKYNYSAAPAPTYKKGYYDNDSLGRTTCSTASPDMHDTVSKDLDWDARPDYANAEISLEEVKACDDEVNILSEKHKVEGLRRWATWDECGMGMPKRLIEIMRDEARFPKPTTIQSYVWPQMMAQEDMIGVAKTGSGKTLAFLIPAFVSVKLVESHVGWPEKSIAGPHVLVIAPTRELCQQIFAESEKFGRPAGIRTCIAYGGDSRDQQLQKLRRNNPHVVVATPGRLVDFIENGDVDLSTCKFVILDEADRMLDMGFEWDIRKIVERAPDDRQSLLFSATFPKAVHSLAKKFTYRDAVHIQIGSDDPLTGNKDIVQYVKIFKNQVEKDNHLWSIICNHWDMARHMWKDGDFKYLIFCNSKSDCSMLSDKFNQWGIDSCALHGDMNQQSRNRSIQRLKDGTCKCLFATDVASRGLDIPGVTAVINYEPTKDKETHVHRIGRTGRAGARGEAWTFLLETERYYVKDIVYTMKKAGQEIEPWLQEIAREVNLVAGPYRGNRRW